MHGDRGNLSADGECYESEGKRPLGRPRLRREDQVKEDVRMMKPDNVLHISTMGRWETARIIMVDSMILMVEYDEEKEDIFMYEFYRN